HPRYDARLQSQLRLIETLASSARPATPGCRCAPPGLHASVGPSRSHLAPERKLTHRTFDMKFDARHFGEQIAIADADRASAQPHVGRHQIERLHQYADVLENERIGNRA